MHEQIWEHTDPDFPGKVALVLEDSGAMESWRRFMSEVNEEGQPKVWKHHFSFWAAKMQALDVFYGGDLEKARLRGVI